MADTTATTNTVQPPPVINGFPRLANEPAGQAGAPPPPAWDPDTERAPEHALLGSLLYAPHAFDAVDTFLGARDFSTPATKAVFTTLRELRRAGALYDVAALPTQQAQLQAAEENRSRLFTALSNRSYSDLPVGDVGEVLAQLTAAAPAECVPLRGIYDPAAQMRLARIVLEASLRRQLRSMGVLMTKGRPVVPGPVTEQAAGPSVQHLEQISGQLRTMTDRLVQAVRRTEVVGTPPPAAQQPHVAPAPSHPPSPPSPPAEQQPRAAAQQPAGTQRARAAMTAGRAGSSRWRLPQPLQAITQRRLHRAERHLIHLALHSGPDAGRLPTEVLDLRPEDFTHPVNANTWRAIQDLRRQGLPINYVSLHLRTADPSWGHHPTLSARDLGRLAQPPELRPERVARTLQTVVTAGIRRASRSAGRAVSALATPELDVRSALDEAQRQVSVLTARTRTAAAVHHATQPTQQSSPRR
ncbi:MAG TPA: DnaB-like helicase N-terminal domain-containing protein [Pseudonocardiaceae bacterium]